MDTDAQTDKRLKLIRRFTMATLQKRIPSGALPTEAVTFLLPDDDPEFTEREIAIAAEIAIMGDDVYLRHVRVAELPE